ncbi:MAG: Maf family protein [Spirochaetales bacterium]|nr:Maf family protein [Spirochaetales bacterium]
MTKRIYLASASPRRKELVLQMGLECTVVPVDVEEHLDQGIPAHILACELSELKMKACLEMSSRYPDDAVFLTADTLISLDDEKIGKPDSRDEAFRILEKLQGRSHQVITGFSLAGGGIEGIFTESEVTDVTFCPMNSFEIEEYLGTEEWKGVAGAYRIQEQGGKYISSLNGTFYNVMGLPINRIYGILSRLIFS